MRGSPAAAQGLLALSAGSPEQGCRDSLAVAAQTCGQALNWKCGPLKDASAAGVTPCSCQLRPAGQDMAELLGQRVPNQNTDSVSQARLSVKQGFKSVLGMPPAQRLTWDIF